jgi:hypothetical protein
MIDADGAGLQIYGRQAPSNPEWVCCAGAEMGDALPPVALGTNRRAVFIAVGGHCCALLVSCRARGGQDA